MLQRKEVIFHPIWEELVQKFRHIMPRLSCGHPPPGHVVPTGEVATPSDTCSPELTDSNRRFER
jgi:hypothetical protein